MSNWRRFHARKNTRLSFVSVASMLALPLVLVSPVFARTGRGAYPLMLHRSQPMHALRFEIQDFNDSDVLVSNDSNAPAEQMADQIIFAWTNSIQPRAESKDPLSDTSDDDDQSSDDGDDDSE